MYLAQLGIMASWLTGQLYTGKLKKIIKFAIHCRFNKVTAILLHYQCIQADFQLETVVKWLPKMIYHICIVRIIFKYTNLRC